MSVRKTSETMAKLSPRSLKTTLLGLVIGLFTALPGDAAGFDIPADLGSYAVLSCKDLKIAGNSVVNSEGLGSATSQGEEGHVRSNGDVLLDGSVEVHGDAVAGPGRQVRLSGQPALVTGEKKVATSPYVCVPVDLAALRATLAAQNDNSLIPLTAKGKPALGGPNGRTLELNGKDELTLPAGTYLLDELRLSGNARLRVAGEVRILVTGAIDVKGGSHVHLDGNPYQVRLWSLGATVSIASQSNVHAFLYAPAAALTLSGQSRVVGGVQADRVEILGGSRVRRVVDDAPPVLTVTAPQDGQPVEVCTIPVTGTVADGESPVQLTVNGAPVTPAADGSFSTTTSLAIADPGLIEVVAVDRAGNTARVAVRVRIVLPVVALTSPADPLVGTRTVNLAGTSGTATEVTVNGIPAVVTAGTFSLAGFDLGAQDGLVTLEIVGRNCGGTGTATAVLDLDTLPPAVAIDSPSQGDLFGNSPIAVTGTVEDAHLTSVTVNGVAATVEGQRFTAEGVALTEGNNDLVATATDALGRTATATVRVELDTTAPSVTITEPESGKVVSTPQIVVRGTVSDVNLAQVTVNGVAAAVSGTSFQVTVTLAEGENFLVAVARDALGNQAESPKVVVVLDTLPPAVTLDAEALPELTDVNKVTVRGTVSDPHLDQVTVNGVEARVVGEEYVAEDVPLQEGANPIVARAVDTLGHAAETAPASVTLDTLAPQVAVTVPEADAQLDSRTVTVRGTVVDPHLERVTVLGVVATVTGSTFEAVGVELPEGASEIYAVAVDSLDHEAESARVPVVVDTLPPVVRLDSPQDPLVSTATVEVTGKAEDPHLAEVTVKDLPAVVEPDGTFSVAAVPLVEGPNEIRATARDTFDHETTSDPVLYVLDTQPPAVAITSPADGEVVTSLEVVVAGTVADPHLLGVTVNGVEATVDETAGTWLAVVPLSDGANTLTAVATDRAGHTAEAAVTVVLDSLPPAVTLDQPAVPAGACLGGGAPQTLGGAFLDSNPAAAPVAVEVVDAGGARRTYPGALSADGLRWTAAGVDLGSADGLTTVLVIASDSLGNVSRVSASYRIDAAAPVVRLTLDGAPFPGGALFGRAIAAGVRVEDGPVSSPPAATLTLDGAPYAAGTLITAEGPHVLVATATDCAGHTTTVQAQFTIDRTPPALRSTSPAADARVTTAVTSFSGVSDPDLARATVDGRPAAVSAGAFTLAPFPGREGRNEVSIELEDRAGNRAAYRVAFTVRTVALTVEIREGGGPIPANATFLRPVRPDVRASDSTATVTATLNGAPFASGTEIAQAGTYHLVANAADDWGRTARAEAQFSIDLGAPPQIAVTSPADGAVLPGPAVRVEGTVSGDAPTVTVNGVAATVTNGTWAVASLPLEADAATEIVATARDRFGRTATAGVTVRVVSGGPQVLILEPADGTVTNRSVIDVAGAVVGGRDRSADGTVTVQGRSIELAPDGTFRALDVPLQSGANTLTATVVDREDRTGSASVSVTADFTPPTLRFFVRSNGPEEPLVDGASFGRPVTLIVEATDDSELDSAPSIRLNGAVQAGATVPRTEIALTASGGYVVSADVEDVAGNEARAERSFVLDFGGCSLADVSPDSGSAVASATVSLVGRATGAAAIKVRVPQPGGGTQEYSASLADGTFLAGDVPLPAVGENRLELVCQDAVGGVQTTPHVIERLAADAGPVIDITAPAAGAVLGVDSIAVTGTVTNGAVTVNGLSAAVTPGTPLDAFSAANVPLSEGPNPLLARAVDAAGRSAEDRIVVQRDTQAPRVQITRPDNHAQVGIAGSGPAAIDVSGLVDLDGEPNLASVVVSSSQGSVTATVDPQTGVFVAQGVPLDAAATGEQTLTVTATDTLGHAGTATVAVALDPAGPALVLSAPADLARFRAGAAGPVTVSGQAWGAPGTAISVNGVDLDPAGLAWSSAGPDGRRQVTFTASVNLPSSDGPFGIIARATDLQGRVAQDRRLLYRDTQALRVVEMVPADGAAGVDANGLLLVLFSEPVLHSSLDAADGLRLTRTSTGQDVVGSKAVAGQAVGFVPGAALAAGETYVLRAGTGITDVAGNALATPAEVRFTVAASSTGGAPVLQPLPAVLCADEIQVQGTAAPGATLKVRDGDLTFTGFADTAGAFTVSVPVTGSGYHLLAVWALDAVTGARSPEATAVVRIDCRAPLVTEARLDRDTATVRIVFSEAVDPATLAVGGAEAAIRLLDAEVPGVYQTGTQSTPGANEAQVQLDASASAWWRDRPVRLQVGPPAADLEGNAMAAVYERVFFPGGSDLSGGFLFGEVYDDTTGRPLAGVPVSLFGSGQGSAVAGAVTDGRGRFVLAGEVPAGRYVLVSGSEDTTRVYRRLSLRPSAGVVPFDSRVTPLAEPAGTLEPAAGGSVTSGSLTFAADAAALPGAAPVSVRLTPLSGQGLPDFLPLGWTPLAAAEVRLEQDGTVLAELPGSASLELTLAAGAPSTGLVAARYEAGTGRWLALPDPETVAAGRVRVALAGPGTVAVVIPDAATSPSAGEPLAGVERPEQTPALVADLTLDPPVVAPTGRARARVVARSADGTTPWPSGLAVQAFLEERLVLTGGGEELEAPFSADLVLYHPALTPAEQGGAAPSAAGAMEFMVSPSPRAAQVLLEVGWENIRLFPFPEEVERGPLVGPDGGTVDSPEGVELSIPEGALTAKVPVSATLLTAAELAALPAVAGYDTLAAVRVELSGATLARPATLALPKPSATPSDSQAEPRVILAELIDAPVDGRGTLARMVARTRQEGQRVVAAPELAGLLPLDGIVREGLYLLLAAQQPLGFSTGFVRAGNDTPVAQSRVTADGLGTGDLSRLTGRYAVPVPAGASRRLVARHPGLDERGEGTIPSLAPGQVVNLDLTVAAVPPRVVSFTPADGAANQPLASAVSVLFSEALDPATVTSSTLTLELAGPDGEATGIFVDGSVTLSEGVRVVFAPKRPLLPGRTFRALFTGGVADAGGAVYAGAPVLWRFSTSTAIVAGGQVHPEKFHVRLPVNGVAEIWGEPGAMPGALPGQVPWVVTPEIEGPVADPQRDTFQARADGSFTGTVGHPPGFAVTIGSRIWVKVFDPTGTLAAEFRVGPFTTPDGLGFVAPAGEAVTFRSAEGLVVDVPAGAFTEATLVTLRKLDPASLGLPAPQGLGVGAFIDLDFEGEAAETLRVSVPAPANAADGAQVFIGAAVTLPWGRRLQLLSVGGVLERDGQRYLSNDPSLQPELPVSASGPASVAGASALRLQTAQAELPRRFVQSLLMEFTLRSQAVFYYEQGVDWTLLVGSSTPFAFGLGAAQEAIFNTLADLWVYLPVPHDWSGGFVLPVLSNQPLELVRRDRATGWILARKSYGPVDNDVAVLSVPLDSEQDPVPPMLVDAQPFHLLRFAAPDDGETVPVRLEVEATGEDGKVKLAPSSGYPLPEGTHLALFDIEPALALFTDESFGPPVAGPTAQVCGEAAWEMPPFEGSPEMLLVVSPGDLEPGSSEVFEFQFDRALKTIPEGTTVAKLTDLGPETGCSSAGGAGYPKTIGVAVELAAQDTRLVVTPQSPLAAGHRFRLELVPGALISAATGVEAWSTLPARFDFATREVEGEPIASMPGGQPALGTTSVARDMLKLGNLLLVASETGDLVAVDVSRASEPEGLRRHSLKNKGVQSATRALATDGHNRVFYAGLFGSIWGIKAMRLEDVLDATTAQCADSPAWAAGMPCFGGVEGSVRVAYSLGSLSGSTASEWLAAGTLPEATPMRLAVLAQDEKGKKLELADFAGKYRPGGLSGLVPDNGVYTFDVALRSTLTRSQAGQLEPSLPPGSAPEPAVAEWRTKVCDGEEDYDRYQRVTVDNLTTGQSWSIDVENPWPDGGSGNGTATLQGIRARRGDQLQVRYNLRTLGHVALLGSGITVVDLNRFYRLLQPYQTPGSGQCGRRLGKFEGQEMEFPACAPASIGMEGIAMTPAVVTHSATGCGEAGGACRGQGFIDIYSPLSRVGALHTRSTLTAPGGASSLFGEGESLQVADLAACIQQVNGQSVMLRDVALANDVEWLDRSIRGGLSGGFLPPPAFRKALKVRGDLLFVTLGSPGIFVFDVSARSLTTSAQGGPALVGHLYAPGHSAFRVQVDPVRELLFAGGTDAATGKPVIDVWDLAAINGAPDLEGRPAPIATLHAPWSTNQLGIDASGTGLLYTWGAAEGPLVVPFDRAQFTLAGLYRPFAPDADPKESITRATTSFVPLGVPMELTPQDEAARREQNDRHATAAFKVRVALPGSLGPALTARVESLVTLPSEHLLGQKDLGAATAAPGGPGWPEPGVTVTLRRLTGDELSGGFNLYESEETVLLLADPRAGKDYRRQEVAGSEADEESQCRRCKWPSYLPDPAGTAPELAKVEELLAGGRYLRVFLAEDPDGDPAVRVATHSAIAFFEQQEEGYPLPAGWAEVSAFADAVPSPVQASLAEPAQSPAAWPGPGGVSVTLAGGEAVLSTVDHQVSGRALAVTFDRSYRSHTLGYGPLGSAGWSSGLFAHLREIGTTAEVEYHDGTGQVFRFLPKKQGACSSAPPVDTHQRDDSGCSYFPPKGLYLRLTKTAYGWRIVDRNHNELRFDRAGRLTEASDRFRQNAEAGVVGSTTRYLYDAFGRLVTIEDDLGRRYRLEYHDDPAADEKRYGLLERIEDFAGRSVEYRYSEDRELEKVLLPEVQNSYFDDLSFAGGERPTVEYRYAPAEAVSSGSQAAVLHGDFAALRLGAVVLPAYLPGGNRPERVKLGYDASTGRVVSIAEPGVTAWRLAYPEQPSTAAPATKVEVTAPWDHEVTWTLSQGRISSTRETVPVAGSEGEASLQEVTTSFSYAADGRPTQVSHPDGGIDFWCYADGEPGAVAADAACPAAEGQPDFLALANVTLAGRAASGVSQGTAQYSVLATTVSSYNTDNVAEAVEDGRSREIDLVVPAVDPETKKGSDDQKLEYTDNPETDGVGFHFEFDAHARPTSRVGTGDAPPSWEARYGEDEKGRQGAGLLEQVKQGGITSDLEYDDRGNLERRESSWGAVDRFVYDEWDRPIHEETGIPAGALAAPGACGDGGAKVWRGFDAAGHLVAERRLQDALDASGGAVCREVETRYEYDALERLVAVRQSHLAGASPGEVDAGLREVVRYEYDGDGLLERVIRRNDADADVVTTFGYDEAGRVKSEQTGESGERRVLYDVKGRESVRTDGDHGIVTTSYDAWDRPVEQHLPTGAVVKREWDQAGGLIRETVHDGAGGPRLTETRSDYTTFGALAHTEEVLTQTLDGEGKVTAETFRKTAYLYDGNGRLDEIWAGEGETGYQRKLAIYHYEPETGRLLSEGGGGEFFHSQGLVERHYSYEGTAPWPSTIQEMEATPEGSLVSTVLHTIQRDTLGRPVRDTGSDGSVLVTRYDRTGGAIGWETGVGTSWGVALDSAGKVVREIRPAGRGESRFGYDLDGRLLVEERTFSGGAWRTENSYDLAGRLLSVLHPDGTQESWTYEPDDVPATWTTRDGVTITYGYDDANRVRSLTPSAAPEASVRIDGGDSYDFDPLSRLLAARRTAPDQTVRYEGWDLGGRPAREIVGDRQPIARSYDVFDNPLQTQLPGGHLQPAGAIAGWSRGFDTLDRVTAVGPLGSGAHASGAAWEWGGAARLFEMTTAGGRGTQARFGYHGGPGPSSSAEPAPWRLGALEWGTSGGASWGKFEAGWRQGDGAKLSRPSAGGPFAGLGWSYGYDAGVRLSSASGALDNWGFDYGLGDEREWERRDQAGELTLFGSGANGRIETRGASAFDHDLSGRRTDDDRFSYLWDWRGQLVEVTVKDTWPDLDGDGELDRSPFAGHQVRYRYDAAGRLFQREHRGVQLATGDRTLLEFREYVWDGEMLATEISWASPERTAVRWRKTYVPGASGLDDSVQVVVEIGDQAGNPFANSTHLYTYLRDEMGSVVGMVAEEEAPAEASKPAAPVRYLYTPYGEAHAESGPELRRARYDNSLIQAGGIDQDVPDPRAAAPGAMVLDWSLGIDAASLAQGLAVEKLEAGTGWVALSSSQAVAAVESAEGDLGRVVAMAVRGWERGTSYRVRIKPELRDTLGRPFGNTESLEWRVPDPPADPNSPLPSIAFDKKIPVRFESWAAAWNDVGGRFPGGQTALFQGLYTDNVTGLSYARARWYDARNAAWLSEDPVDAVDSVNRYAFVGHMPNMATDPRGLCLGFNDEVCSATADRFSAWIREKEAGAYSDEAGLVGFMQDWAVGAAADAAEMFLADPLRVGESTGEAVGSGASGGQVALAVLEDFGRASSIAGPLAGGARLVGVGSKAARAMSRGRRALAETAEVAENYLVSERRIQRFQAQVDRLRKTGQHSGERLAELQGRVEMLREGYVRAGQSKLVGNLSRPGRGKGVQGLDQVFRHVDDPSNLAILESKFSGAFQIGSDPTALLKPTKMGLQMSHSWVQRNIFKMITGPHTPRINALGWELGTRGYRRYMNVMNAAGESGLFGLTF